MGVQLGRVHGGVSWWIGDWWAFGSERRYGEGEEVCERIGLEYGTVRVYATVARAYQLLNRFNNVSFTHHFVAMAAPAAERQAWLERTAREKWSANELKAAIARQAALARTRQVERQLGGQFKFMMRSTIASTRLASSRSSGNIATISAARRRS